jgi:hypothetical protein
MLGCRYICGCLAALTLGAAASFGAESNETGRHLSGPYTCKNLTVFLVHGPDFVKEEKMLTLAEALAEELVIVHETGDVGELAAENLSDFPVYIQAGDIVKGGRQDRLLRYDFVLAPRSGRQPLASFCVEQGRWSSRGSERADRFEVADKMAGHKDIMIAAKVAESQSDVWDRVADVEDKLSLKIRGGRAEPISIISPTSLALTQEHDDVQARTEEYVESLQAQITVQDNAVGLVVAINGRVGSADIYRSTALFRKQYPRLIEAAAIEAIAEYDDSDSSCPIISVEAVQDWLATADSGATEEKQIGRLMKVRMTANDQSITFESFETDTDTAWVHKNIVAK